MPQLSICMHGRALKRPVKTTNKRHQKQHKTKLTASWPSHALHTERRTTMSSVALLADQTRLRPVLLWHGLAALKEPLAGPVPAHAQTLFSKQFYLTPVEPDRCHMVRSQSKVNQTPNVLSTSDNKAIAWCTLASSILHSTVKLAMPACSRHL